jgi:amidase
MDELWMWTAIETAERVRAGDVSAVEVTIAQLARIDAMAPLNAVTRRNDEQALRDAATVDAALARGERLGPLAGVGFTVKDSVDVTGQSTPNGVATLNQRLATSDSPAIASLRSAGAIVIGRTNAPEFSWRWHTDNPLFGATKNPWRGDLTPGGSSGGAAAALASGVGAIAHGSDAGGSLRWPAAACGVSTIRPTQHRVPSHNSTSDAERSPAIDLMAVHGPMARNVADLRVALEVMAQPSWRDPVQVTAPFGFGQPRIGRAAVAVGLDRSPSVAKTMAAAAARLVDAGWTTVEVEPPSLVECAHLWARMLNTDFDQNLRVRMNELGSPQLLLMLEVLHAYGPSLTLADYLGAYSRRLAILREWQRLLIDEVDVLILPICREPTWRVGDDEHRSRLEELVIANEPLTAINFLGLPAASQPVYVVDGVPSSVQLVAARFNEASALAAAEAIEQRGAVDYRQLWAGLR